MLYGSRKTLELLDEERVSQSGGSDIMAELDEKMVELRKERQKFYDMRNAFNKVIRERSRQEELNEILVSAVQSGELPELSYERHYIETSDNDLLCSLNDMHYGVDIHNAWNTYNPEVCREMMCAYLDKILQIAERHGSENCYVFNNGDTISGKIHLTIQIANKENVIEQVKGASELIAEFLAELSKHFKTVTYVSVAGNHSRLDTKENSPLDERMDDLIGWYLSARLQNFDNVVIGGANNIDSTMYLLDIRGKAYLGVHGDFDGSMTKIASLQAMARCPIYAVLSGHLHHNRIDEVQGVKTVMAGSFLGMDDFCIQKRIYGRPEQMVCVCDETGIVCHYDIPLA
jgi:predicted phosphodiesterase